MAKRSRNTLSRASTPTPSVPCQCSTTIASMKDLMEKMSETLNQLMSCLQLQLNGSSSSQQPTNVPSSSSFSGLNQVNSSLPYGCPPYLNDPRANALFSQVHTTRSLHMMAEKDKHAVIELLPEPVPADPRNVQTSYPEDEGFIRHICLKGDVKGFVSCWRHPSRNSANSRIVKARFEAPTDRDQFIRVFKANLPSTFTGRIRIRRDMTPIELQLLYGLRKKAFDLNQEAGWGLWFVRDLELVQNKPRYGPNYSSPPPLSSRH